MPKTVDVYYALSSPWTYLAWQRFRAMATKAGAKVNWWPVDFGKIFPQSGGLMLPQRAPQRQAYRLMELKRWRDHLGDPINIQPKFFPVPDGLAAHTAVAVRRSGGDIAEFSWRILRGVWAEERNIADAATLIAIADGMGLDGKALLAAADSAEIKAERERDNDAAIK